MAAGGDRDYPAAVFAKDGTQGTLNGGSCQWTFTGGGGAGTLTAPLKAFAVGDRLFQITWAYNRGGAGTVTMRLKRRKNDGSAAEVIALLIGTDVDNSGAANEINLITYNHVIEPGYFYYLQFDIDAAATGCVFFGAEVIADRFPPA